jgi:hypothetical protein
MTHQPWAFLQLRSDGGAWQNPAKADRRSRRYEGAHPRIVKADSGGILNPAAHPPAEASNDSWLSISISPRLQRWAWRQRGSRCTEGSLSTDADASARPPPGGEGARHQHWQDIGAPAHAIAMAPMQNESNIKNAEFDAAP